MTKKEKWVCVVCKLPCTIEIDYSDEKLPKHLNGNERFRDKKCFCSEDTPEWTRIVDIISPTSKVIGKPPMPLMPPITKVETEIKKERKRQISKGYGSDHDDKETPENFCRYIIAYATWAEMMDNMGSGDKYRRRMLQIAAIATAACEAFDRKL